MVLDPFSALAVATAAAQFIDFTSKIIAETVLPKGRAEASNETLDLKLITSKLKKNSSDLKDSISKCGEVDVEHDHELQLICIECNKIATELIALLEKLDAPVRQQAD